jgi:hypothetical protein
MSISGSKLKQVNTFICLGSVVEKNGKIHNKINERLRRASQFCYQIKSILQGKDLESIKSIKPLYIIYILRRYYYTERRHGHALGERKEKYKQLRCSS